MTRYLIGLILFGLCAAISSIAAEEGVEKKPNVTYRSGKEVDFEKLLIQGQMKRPELSIVTGSTDQGTDGLLRLRENFVDRMAVSLGEPIAPENSKGDAQ